MLNYGWNGKRFSPFQKSNCLNLIFVLVLIIISETRGQKRAFDISPEIPSHLPSPPAAAPPPAAAAPAAAATANGGGSSIMSDGSNIGGFFGGTPPNPPPQNTPVGPGGPGPVGPLGPGLFPPEDFVPFGLNHIILIMVPQFKAKFRRTPGWIESSIKISMPITVFFDKLDLGPNFPIPPPGGFPPGLGLRPPFSLAGGMAGGGVAGGGGYPYGAYPYSNFDEDDEEREDDTELFQSEDPDDGGTNDGYGNDHDDSSYYEEDRSLRKRKRRKRNLYLENEGTTHTIKKRSVPFNRTIHAAERAVLLPKLERLMDTTGLGGRSCLLRAICEVHEAPLHHYGLLGELFTMFFSVSRSMFAESHLPDYLRAELTGKTGDCSEFYQDCDKTLFSWEEQIIPVTNKL